MTEHVAPEMSVVLVSPDGYDRLRRSMQHLRNQTASDRLEVVIVSPSTGRVEVDPAELDGFAGAQLVEIASLETLGAAIAAGYRSAKAPIVTYCEEHSFPEPGWAKALLDAHRGPWAAVGGALRNANPTRALSWGSLLCDFGPFIHPAGPPGERRTVPSHHTSYKAEVLLRYEARLDTFLEAEPSLHEELRRAGEQVYFETRAQVAHLNPSRLWSHLRSQFLGGRLFTARRAESEAWPPWLRLADAALAPAWLVRRLYRMRTDIRRVGVPGGLSRRLWGAIGVGLVASMLGQLAGLALGAGSSARRRIDIELDRSAHMAAGDRQASTSA